MNVVGLACRPSVALVRGKQPDRIMFNEMVEEQRSGTGDAIPVLISIEPGMLALPDTEVSLDYMKKVIEGGVKKGLRASLQTGNLLSGSLYVSMDFHDGAEPQGLGTFTTYSTIPTVHVGLAKIQEQISNVLTELNDLPLEKTVKSIDSMVVSITKKMGSANATKGQPILFFRALLLGVRGGSQSLGVGVARHRRGCRRRGRRRAFQNG